MPDPGNKIALLKLVCLDYICAIPNTYMEYIAYYRVSTQKQNRSGLGLDAQQSSVLQYIGSNELIGEYTDIESGRNNQRIQLAEAIHQANQTGATLVIAKLDRLSRDVQFISTLMKTKVKFKCCDMPEADNFTIHIFAALAERERAMISTRTKEALQAAKRRGKKLGNPNTPKGSEAAKIALKKAREARVYINPHPDKIQAIKAMKQSGTSITDITTKSPTLLGRQYSRVQIWRLLK